MESTPAWSITRLERPDELDRVAALEAASFAHPSTREVLARELQDSKVTRMYVLRLPAPRNRCVLCLLAGRGRGAHQHA